MSNKTTKKLAKEPLYLRITGFSRMKKYELEKAIRDANTKETQTGDSEACEQCLHKQHKQRLIDEKMYTKKVLENKLRKLSLLCKNCSCDHVVIDGDVNYVETVELCSLICRLWELINHRTVVVTHTLCGICSLDSGSICKLL